MGEDAAQQVEPVLFLDDDKEKQNSKMEVIVTFLIILEMMKIGKIDIEQKELFDDIEITYKGDSE